MHGFDSRGDAVNIGTKYQIICVVCQQSITMPSYSKSILPINVNNSTTKPFRIVLHDIFQCFVRLERLTDGEILAITKRDGFTDGPTLNIPSHQRDHNYSRAFIISRVLNEPESAIHSSSVAVRTNTNVSSFSCSFGSSGESNYITADDDDIDDDTSEGGYSFENGKSVPYRVRAGLEFDENNDSEGNGRKRFLSTNKQHQQADKDSLINGKSPEKSNSMDMDMDTDPKIDDQDDDMQFLMSIGDRLNQPDNQETNANRTVNGETWLSNRIFGEMCIKYLRNECYSTLCQYSHELPALELMENRLIMATERDIEEVQNEILIRHECLLAEYLPIFCKYYGRVWQTHRESLRQLIPVLSRKPLAQVYLKEIRNGLLISDVKYSTCIELLLLEMDDSFIAEEQFEIMWDMIIDGRNEKANEHLKEFEHVLYGDAIISANAINRILQHRINGELDCLSEMANHLVKKSTVTTFRKIEPNLLKNYAWHMQSIDPNVSKVIKQKAAQFGITLDN